MPGLFLPFPGSVFHHSPVPEASAQHSVLIFCSVVAAVFDLFADPCFDPDFVFACPDLCSDLYFCPFYPYPYPCLCPCLAAFSSPLPFSFSWRRRGYIWFQDRW